MMEKQKFKIGDHVQLISGGPAMTVREYNKDLVKCEWFAKEEFKSHLFEEEQLKPYRRSSRGVRVIN